MSIETLETVRELHQQLQAIRAEERAAALELRAAILSARAAGHSLADIGQVLGLSRQRVLQLSK